MLKLSLMIIEKIIYRFILNEKRVYQYWYSRFLMCGMDLSRTKRVISRIRNFYCWCDEWSKEGDHLAGLANDALAQGNYYVARRLYHEAVACYHIAQHIFFLDIPKKNQAQENARRNYVKAISLYDKNEMPMRIEIPFRETIIPGYLHLSRIKNRPLIIHINGLDNIKEAENHYWANLLKDAGFNVCVFDGPGQGEMRKSMAYIPDYYQAVSAIIDWFYKNDQYEINLKKVATTGLSFGCFLSAQAAAYDKRISCAVGNSSPAFIKHTSQTLINPIWVRDLLYVTGCNSVKQAIEKFGGDIDIKKVPPLDRPLLIIQGGNDKLIRNPKMHAEYFMDWAIGEKELKYYPDGDHCCVNYSDEIFPYIIDWLEKHLK